MHILILPSEHYTTELNPLGGIFQYHHARLLQDFGMQTGIISAGLVPFAQQFKSYPFKRFKLEEGIPVYRNYVRVFIPGRFAFSIFAGYIIRLYVKLFEAYIRQYGKPDVLHAHNALLAGAAAMRIKKKYGIPFVITEHSSLYQRGLVNEAQINIARQVMQNADARTVVSNKLGNSLKDILGEMMVPFTAIFNVLENEFIESDLPSVKNGNEFVFLSIGSLDDNKNHISLIRAFNKAFPNESSVKLRIGGSGPTHTLLEQTIAELGMHDRIELIGQLSRLEVKAEMAAVNTFVLPSKVETFGVVLIEALAQGIPVISTHSGGPEDIVNPTNGLLVDPDDDEAMSTALQSIYKNKSAYSAEAIRRDCLQRFGRETFFKRLEQIYKQVTN